MRRCPSFVRWLIAVATMIVAVACTGCGSAHHRAQSTGRTHTSASLARLISARRPIGAGRRFHPPVRGSPLGACRRRLGRREEAHIELFAANKVVLLPAGIGIRHPRIGPSDRVDSGRCYGSLVTLDPTGVVYIRPGAVRTLAELFDAWGQPLSRTRLAGFTAASGVRVSIFIDGRRRAGPPGTAVLTNHAEIVLEVGPHVPPHLSYTFPAGPS
jgi:hypothetical protein